MTIAIEFCEKINYNYVMSENYYKESNKKNHDKLETLLPCLPTFCKEYFIGIEMRTSMLTQLNYARDFCVFFDYILQKRKDFSLQSPTELTLEHLNRLETTDIEYFLSYLSYYTYNGTEHENNERAKARKLSSVRSLFKYFYNKDKLDRDVASKVNVPKLHEKPIIRLDNSEVKEMLYITEKEEKFDSEFKNKYNLNTRDRDLAIVTLLLGTGIRVSECVGLNVKDVDIEKRTFVVTRKGGNRVMLFFSEEVAEALENYLAERKKSIETSPKITVEDPGPEALFLSLRMKRISVRAVEILVKKYAKEVAPLKKISPHKLRSTYGTALYHETKDIYVVAEVLGHKDINTTKKHYAAMDEHVRREASTKVVLREELKN